jgi:hypothetical protein
MTHSKTTGTRAEVWHGTAKHTSGGLEKKDLLKNKHGRIVSKRKHNSEKKSKRLIKAGYGTKKGKFGFVLLGTGKGSKKGSKKGGKYSRRLILGRAGGRSRKYRGGNGVNYALSPTEVSGMIGTTAENPSTGVQFAAGRGN